MNIWAMLGIEPTGDKKLIKKAYAKQLKVYHPETDPEGYQRLRSAYDTAMKQSVWMAKLAQAKQEEETQDEAMQGQPDEAQETAQQVSGNAEQQDEPAITAEKAQQIDEPEQDTGEAENDIDLSGLIFEDDEQFVFDDDKEPEQESNAGQFRLYTFAPETEQQSGSQPDMETLLDEFLHAARQLINDKGKNESTLAWAQLFTGYDDIIWGEGYRPRAEAGLMKMLADKYWLLQNKELWQMFEDCFGWAHKIASNREHYTSTHGESFVDAYLRHYSEDYQAEVKRMAEKIRTQNAKSKRSQKKSWVMIAVMILFSSLIYSLGRGTARTGTVDIPVAPIPSLYPIPTLDLEGLQGDLGISGAFGGSDKDGSFDTQLGIPLQNSRLAGCGTKGFASHEQAMEMLPALIEAGDWEQLYDYADPCALIEPMFLNNYSGTQTKEFFAEYMENWREPMLGENGLRMDARNERQSEVYGMYAVNYYYGNGDSDYKYVVFQQREGRWLVQFSEPGLGGELQNVLLYRELDNETWRLVDEGEKNTIVPMYYFDRGDRAMLGLIMKSSEPMKDVVMLCDTTVEELEINRRVDGFEGYDNMYVVHLSFRSGMRYIYSIYGKTKETDEFIRQNIGFEDNATDTQETDGQVEGDIVPAQETR